MIVKQISRETMFAELGQHGQRGFPLFGYGDVAKDAHHDLKQNQPALSERFKTRAMASHMIGKQVAVCDDGKERSSGPAQSSTLDQEPPRRAK